MPEYSSTTITPSDGVQVPGMNGSTSGNFLLSALRDFILASKGQANGLASLGSDGKLTASQLPDLADDVIVVASYATLPATGTAGKIYITADNNKMYRWDPDLATPDYVELSIDLSAYATKAELAEEESARTAADSNLLSAIQGNTARIENLEQEHGGYVPVNYRGTNDVPSGKAKYALVESIVGKSRAWNQLFSGISDFSSDGYSVSYSNGTLTITNVSGTAGLSTNRSTTETVDIVNGHKYLIGFSKTLPTGLTLGIRVGAGAWVYATNAIEIISPTASGTMTFRIVITSEYTGTWAGEVYIRDMTTILSDWSASDITTANIPLMVKQIPDLLKYDAYGYSLVDTVVEGVKSTSINIWDEDWESGDISSSTGENVPSSSYIRGVNYYPCLPSTEYYGKAENKIYLLWYDIQKNYIGYTANGFQNTYKESPVNAFYFRISINTTSYGNNVQVCLNSYADKTTYHPHILDTLSLPSSVTLRSAGSVAEVYDLETGEKTNTIGKTTFTASTSWENASGTTYMTTIGVVNSNKDALLQGPYRQVSSYSECINNVGTFYIGGTGNDKAYINDSAFTSALACQSTMANRTIYYGLATPDDPTQLTPVINNTIQTEGGGTINTIQTQTPVIDNSLDVGYLAL